MTESQDTNDIETVVGEMVEGEVSAFDETDASEVIELDDDAVLAEEDDESIDQTGQTGQTDRTDQADGDVMVLDTWQIELPATGDDKVDAALARLTEVEGLPPARHAEVYESVHAGLQDALADLDQA